MEYKTVYIDPDGASSSKNFGSNKEMALDYAITRTNMEPISTCMVYRVDGKKTKLIWSKLEGFLDD